MSGHSDRVLAHDFDTILAVVVIWAESPGALVTWQPDALLIPMVPWYPGSPWYSGTLVPWPPGSLVVPWNPGTLVTARVPGGYLSTWEAGHTRTRQGEQATTRHPEDLNPLPDMVRFSSVENFLRALVRW